MLKSLPTYDGLSHIKTWVLSIAKHVAVDHYRRKKIVSFVNDYLLKGIPSQEKSPERLVHDQEEHDCLHRAIQMLKPKYRMVVILRALKEYSIKETAEILGCSEAKVKVDYHRALRMLNQKLDSPMKGRVVLDESPN